jgi:hypothetical protein
VDETNVDMLWIGVVKNGNVKSWCEEDEGTDCAVERATLIGKGR